MNQFAASRLVKNRNLRYLYIGCGWLSLVLGIIGVFLPLLPTTPFIVLAAACFARGSERFYSQLLSHPIFGPHLHDWELTRSVPMQAKVIGILSIAISMGISGTFFLSSTRARLILASIGLAVSLYIMRLPTRRALPKVLKNLSARCQAFQEVSKQCSFALAEFEKWKQFSSMSIFRVIGSEGTLVVSAGKPMNVARFEVGMGHLGKCAEKGSIHLLEEAEEMSFPILTQGKIIGVLLLQDIATRSMGSEDQLIIATFCRELAPLLQEKD